MRITVHTYSTTANAMATRHGTTKATRHIQPLYLALTDLVTTGAIQIRKFAGTENRADILTKFVIAETLQRLIHRVGFSTHTALRIFSLAASTRAKKKK